MLSMSSMKCFSVIAFNCLVLTDVWMLKNILCFVFLNVNGYLDSIFLVHFAHQFYLFFFNQMQVPILHC